MKSKNHLLTILSLSFLAFFSCVDKKTDANDRAGNPFGIPSDTISQILHPCHWTFTVEHNDKGEATLVSTAKLDSGWHLYSQHLSKKGTPTEFTYDSLGTYKLVGDTDEGKPNKKYEPYLKMEVLYFEKEAAFRQKIGVLSKADFVITGTIDYMVCLSESQCVLSDEEFSFEVKGDR